jgi:trimeric autotransporter adhesin
VAASGGCSSTHTESAVPSSSSSTASCGSAWATRRSRPTLVSACHSALTTASSVASTVASNSGSRSPSRNALAPRAVESARKISPLPWWAVEPARARPRPARRAIRVSWDDWSGASVATTTMQLPAGRGRTASVSPSSAPTGTPSIRRCRRSPKFASTSTPTVAAPTRRLEVPIPALKSKLTIPAPAPTAPCAKTASALATARPTPAASTCTARGSLSQLSSHSATTGMTTSSTPTAGSAATAAATAPS